MDWLRSMLGFGEPAPPAAAAAPPPPKIAFKTLYQLALEHAAKHAHSDCERCAQWYPHMLALQKCAQKSTIALTHVSNLTKVYIARVQCVHQSAALAYLDCMRKRGVSLDVAKWMAQRFYCSLRAGRLTMGAWGDYAWALKDVVVLIYRLPGKWHYMDDQWYRCCTQLTKAATELQALKQVICTEDHGAIPHVPVPTLNRAVELLHEIYDDVMKADHTSSWMRAANRSLELRVAKALVDLIVILFPAGQIENDPSLWMCCKEVTRLVHVKKREKFF